jgi:hypothetical protein
MSHFTIHSAHSLYLRAVSPQTPSQGVTSALKSVTWNVCHIVQADDFDRMFCSDTTWQIDTQNPFHLNREHSSSSKRDRVAVIISGALTGCACLIALSSVSDEDSSLQTVQLPTALNLKQIARSTCAADKEFSRLLSSRTETGSSLLIASSLDGCIRAFKVTNAPVHSAVSETLPCQWGLVWRIAAIKSELRAWVTQPLPHMMDSVKTTAMVDAAEGNNVSQQDWLQPIDDSTSGLSASQKLSSSSSRFRAAVRNVGAVAAIARTRDVWFTGGASSASATARWYNLHLGTIDVKRLLETDSDALISALSASDILPIHENSESRSNPKGIEVLSCTVAVTLCDCVMAGYIDGTFRIWKRISSFAPPQEHRQRIAAALLGAEHSGTAVQFYCARTLKLSDAAIADAIMTQDGNCILVCDSAGMQFSVSLCHVPEQRLGKSSAFQFFSQMQTPFWFTVEPSVQVVHNDAVEQ